jgi:hypothetical protein
MYETKTGGLLDRVPIGLDQMSAAEAKKALKEVFEKDQEAVRDVEKSTEQVLEGMDIFKVFDKLHEESGTKNRFK